MKDLGRLHYFLGIEVHYFSGGMILSQSKYACDLLDRAHMSGSKAIPTPMSIKNNASDVSTPFPDPRLFRSIVGGLQYLTMTRPDISFSVNSVCQHMQSPTIGHFQVVKHILRYLNGTIDVGFRLLSQSTLDLYGFSDADWAACPTT